MRTETCNIHRWLENVYNGHPRVCVQLDGSEKSDHEECDFKCPGLKGNHRAARQRQGEKLDALVAGESLEGGHREFRPSLRVPRERALQVVEECRALRDAGDARCYRRSNKADACRI